MQNFLDIDQVDPQNLRGILDEAARIKNCACWRIQRYAGCRKAARGQDGGVDFRKAIYPDPREL